MINAITNEFLVNEQAELKEINQTYLTIAIKLSFQYQERLEYCNCVLRKILVQLESVNDDCY